MIIRLIDSSMAVQMGKVGYPSPIVPCRDIFPDAIRDLDPHEPACEDTIRIRDGVSHDILPTTLCQPAIYSSEVLLAFSHVGVALSTLRRKLLNLLAKRRFPGCPKIFLTGRVQDVATESELQHQDASQSANYAGLEGLDEGLCARWEEGVAIGVRGIKVFSDEERVRGDFSGVGVIDNGEGVRWAAICLGAGWGCTDLLGEGRDIWVLNPFCLVWNPFDTQSISVGGNDVELLMTFVLPEDPPRLPCVW
jgi:hypothetical protein